VSSIDRLQIALVGTSFRQVGFEELGRLTLGPDQADARALLRQALAGEELVYLSTCNRVECYLAAPKLPKAEDLRQRAAGFFNLRGTPAAPDWFTVKSGAAAVEHLFAVTSSLDSLVAGETDIIRQVKRAALQANEEQLDGAGLKRLFERAVLCARRVHAETGLGSKPVSVATLAVQKIQRHFGPSGPPSSVLVGSGDMIHEVAGALGRYEGDRLFVNRTRAGAEALAAEFGGRASSLDEFQANPPAEIDLLFTATSAPEPVIPPHALEPAMEARQGRAPMIVCDLGVPRDVDPSLEGREGIILLALEHLEVIADLNRQKLELELAQARELVADHAARLSREDRFRALADESTHAILVGRLGHLSEGDRETILRFAKQLAERFARQP